MDSEKLAAVFVELADTLVDDFDVLDLLHVLADRSVQLLGASAAGLMVTDDDGELRLVVSSSEQARLMELFQLQNDEGPCLDCYRSGRPVSVPRLEDEYDRWPNFGRVAAAAGFSSVVALPMRLRGQSIGGLNLFGTTDSPPVDDADLPIAQSLADAATIAILQDRLARGREILNQQLQVALSSRVAIEQAKGVLARHLGVSPEGAFEVLRGRARGSRRRLGELADEVARGDLTLFSPDPSGE